VLVALLLAAASLSGCAGDKTPRTYPVRGKVVYRNNQQPLAQGAVLFESATEPKVQASGEIQPDGSFELASDLGKPGTVIGEHRVLIQPPVLEAGQKPVVHKRYTSYSTSGLKATVSANSRNELTLEVER
jgi:hypothetical protein